MSFDSHSLERLKELGRSLPQALPKPGGPASASVPIRASERRHRVETEENPQTLFHELMKVSPDGTVPPHLMERLKRAEGHLSQPPADPKTKAVSSLGKPDRATAIEHGELYTAFQQLLLEDEAN